MAAKPKPNDKPTETPLERTARLAQKLIAVPKAEIDKQSRKYERDKAKRRS
jgi:hypothetical protein